MEKMLLASALRDRASYQLISDHIKTNKYSRAFQIVWDFVGNYYQRDANAAVVLPELLIGYIAETTRNPKHVKEFTDVVNEAWSIDISEANVRQLVLESKRRELADELAIALTSDKEHDELFKEYDAIRQMTDLDELVEEGTQVFDTGDLESMLAEEADDTGRLVIYPEAISDRLGGGARGGHHIVVYGRPESGKSALCISIACGFARQGVSGLYFGNEDRPQDLLIRCISNLIGWTRQQILENPREANLLAKEAGLDNIKMISLAPGTPRQIEDYIKKYQPRWIVIDQLRNVAVKADTRVNQLEAAATFGRNMAKKYRLICISVTQAGDSASNKEVLDMGDVDFSNTGIPAQADVMIGIGTTAVLEQQGFRMLSLPKNKIGGDHSHFTVRIQPFLSRVSTVR
jgi:archaellum biogenesis ATPase FlaH